MTIDDELLKVMLRLKYICDNHGMDQSYVQEANELMDRRHFLWMLKHGKKRLGE